MANKIREVDMGKLLEVTTYLTPYDPTIEQQDIMVRSIKELGIVQPLIVQAIASDDKYAVIDGRDRWMAAKVAGLKKIWVHVVDVPNLARVTEIQIMFNRSGGKIHLRNGFLRIAAVLPGVTIPQLEPRVAMAASEIMKVMDLKYHKEDMQRDVRLGTIPLSNAYALAKLYPHSYEQDKFDKQAKTMKEFEFVPLVNQRVRELKKKTR